jgi:arylsulfatase A-like enzyme
MLQKEAERRMFAVQHRLLRWGEAFLSSKAPLLLLGILLLNVPPSSKAQSAETLRAEAKRPNVVLIVTDDQGYGDLSAHDNQIIKTPHLDRLYAQSVRLRDFHVNPTCSPTRAALMTGQYPTKAGVWHTIAGRSLMSKEEVTIAEVLQAAGYHTGIFGKWHLGDNYPFRPQDQGFQRVVVLGGGGIGQTPDYWGNDHIDDHYRAGGRLRSFSGYSTDVFFDQALEFIKENRDRPFFAYIPTSVAHRPWQVPFAYVRPYLEKGIEGNLARFYGMLTKFDENLGRLRKKLREWELSSNTILIFMTDNGTAANEGFNAGMRGRKGSVYDGGHRVPFFIRWPAGGLRGGRNVDRLTAHIDVLPTLVELIGIQQPDSLQWDGTSLVPLLKDRGGWPDRTLFVHSQRIQHPEKWKSSAVMTEKWRLINRDHLHDMYADFGQRSNVAEQHPEVVARLQKAYNQWWKALKPHLDEYARIVLGSAEANPVRLTAHDWHAPAAKVPWNQDLIRNPDVYGNGFWTVEVARSGTYAFTLRQQPAEAPDAIIEADTARLKIGDEVRTKPVPAKATEITFHARLEDGKARLRTWLKEGGRSRGAYYVCVEYVASSKASCSRSRCGRR